MTSLLLPTCVDDHLSFCSVPPQVSVLPTRDMHCVTTRTDHHPPTRQTLPASKEPFLITPGEQTALPGSHVPVSQAAGIRQASRCLVSVVTSLAKLHTLLPTSVMRKVDTQGSWRRTFSASHGEIQLSSASRLAPCSSQVTAKFPVPYHTLPVSRPVPGQLH